jgi:hypothetical protein
MKDRPLTVDAREANGLHDGSITRVVRVVELQPVGDGEFLEWRPRKGAEPLAMTDVSPFGVPGDRLWVREDFAIIQTGHSTINAIHQQVPYDPAALYRADGHNSVADAIAATVIISGVDGWQSSTDHWRAAETMPRWASRTILDVTDVRVIRAQEITSEDALAAGVCGVCESDGVLYEQTETDPREMCGGRGGIGCMSPEQPVEQFRNLIGEEIWDANAWIWLGTVAKAPADYRGRTVVRQLPADFPYPEEHGY